MKKLFGIFLIILILALGLVSPVGASALPQTIQETGITIADRLVAHQNLDGGWDWGPGDLDLTNTSPSNTLGVTGQGVLDMFKITANPAYLVTCNATYNAMVNNSLSATPSVRKARGPDIGFAVDMSVVTSDSSYATFAAGWWENTKVEFGGGTAEGFAQYVRDMRIGQGWETLVTWDINLYVQSLEKLGNYFPASSYLTEAADMAGVSYAYLYAGAFPLGDETADAYWLTFAGALESFAVTHTHPEKVTELTDNLTGSQQTGGYFLNAGAEDMQTTAYAARALRKAGSYNEASDAVNYMVDQMPTYLGGADENTEVESEVAQAIADLIMATPLDIMATAGAGGAIVPDGTIEVPYDGTQLFTITPDAGYSIDDVMVDGVSVGAVTTYTFTSVRDDRTIEVSFAINTHTLTIIAGTGGTVQATPDQLTYDYGTTVQLQAVANSGYKFTGWSGDLTGDTNPQTILMDADKSVTATFTAAGGGGGGGGSSGGGSYTDTNVLGQTGSIYQNDKGTTRDFTASNDELTISIPKGTKLLDADGDKLPTIEVNPNPNPAPLPEDRNIIGLAYDFAPSGAQFEPSITLTFTYEEGSLPEGVSEENLVLAFYDEAAGQWVELECVVDTATNTITAKVSHFTTFAIIGKSPVIIPEPTETPTVTPTETPTETPTVTPTETPTETPTSTPTVIPTETTTEPSDGGNGASVGWIIFGIIGGIIVAAVVAILVLRSRNK